MPNQSQLEEDLARIGVSEGDTLVIHSSLRSLGRVDGGPKSVIRALLKVIGPEGRLIFPTFTYSGTKSFDPRTTPSRTGLLTEIARHWPGAVRSWHPTHSVTVIGQDAAQLCAGHHLIGGLAKDSPLDRAATQRAQVLLLGVGHTSNSTVHIGEAHADLPFLDIPFGSDDPKSATIITPEGSLRVPIHHPPGCSKAFGAIEHHLRVRGWIRDGNVGASLAQLMPSQVIIDSVVELLRAAPSALLCTDPRCYRCTQSRRVLQ